MIKPIQLQALRTFLHFSSDSKTTPSVPAPATITSFPSVEMNCDLKFSLVERRRVSEVHHRRLRPSRLRTEPSTTSYHYQAKRHRWVLNDVVLFFFPEFIIGETVLSSLAVRLILLEAFDGWSKLRCEFICEKNLGNRPIQNSFEFRLNLEWAQFVPCFGNSSFNFL